MLSAADLFSLDQPQPPYLAQIYLPAYQHSMKPTEAPAGLEVPTGEINYFMHFIITTN